MIYPSFLSRGQTLGIAAPSAGIEKEKIPAFETSLDVLRAEGYRIRETAHVRNEGIVSADAKTRAEELMSLVTDESVAALIMAAGGDFMMEMLPHVDLETIRSHPKWMQGYSDVTNLLFPVTTLLDIATVYGPNAGGYHRAPSPDLRTSLDFLRGDIHPQYRYDFCTPERCFDPPFTEWVVYRVPNGDFTVSGRLLGGCLDCLAETVAGTRFDGTKAFLDRYKQDGVIWYFDIFSLSGEQTARALWRLAEYGWFTNAKAFLFGRVVFPSTFLAMSYEDAVLRALGQSANVVLDFDVGHRPPVMTMINGALATLSVQGETAELSTFLR